MVVQLGRVPERLPAHAVPAGRQPQPRRPGPRSCGAAGTCVSSQSRRMPRRSVRCGTDRRRGRLPPRLSPSPPGEQRNRRDADGDRAARTRRCGFRPPSRPTHPRGHEEERARTPIDARRSSPQPTITATPQTGASEFRPVITPRQSPFRSSPADGHSTTSASTHADERQPVQHRGRSTSRSWSSPAMTHATNGKPDVDQPLATASARAADSMPYSPWPTRRSHATRGRQPAPPPRRGAAAPRSSPRPAATVNTITGCITGPSHLPGSPNTRRSMKEQGSVREHGQRDRRQCRLHWRRAHRCIVGERRTGRIAPGLRADSHAETVSTAAQKSANLVYHFAQRESKSRLQAELAGVVLVVREPPHHRGGVTASCSASCTGRRHPHRERQRRKFRLLPLQRPDRLEPLHRHRQRLMGWLPESATSERRSTSRPRPRSSAAQRRTRCNRPRSARARRDHGGAARTSRGRSSSCSSRSSSRSPSASASGSSPRS